MRIIHRSVTGMRPGIAPDLLPVDAAQTANNCNLFKGQVRPFNAPSLEQALTLEANSIKTIFEYKENGTTHMIETANVVHAVRSPVANDQYERMFTAGESEPRFMANNIVSAPSFDYSTDFLKTGIPAPTGTPAVARVAASGAVYREYFYTHLNAYGDRGPNSPTAAISDYGSGRVTIANIDVPPTGRGIDRIWVFRTATDGAEVGAYEWTCEAKYFDPSLQSVQGDFVVYGDDLWECTDPAGHTGAWNPAHFTEGEQVPDANLGAACESTTWDPPPAGLKGLVMHPCGSVVGYYENTVYISEPNQLHAFPAAYKKSFPYLVVGVRVVGSNIIVITDGVPQMIYGDHPAAMGKTHYNEFLPCANARTIDVWKEAVYYSTNDGLAKITVDGASVITIDQHIIDKDAWESTYNPTHGKFFNNLYFGFSSSITFCIDLISNTVTTLSLRATASYRSIYDGELYLCIDEGGTAYAEKWEGDPQNYLYHTWKSRLNILNYNANFAYGMVMLDSDFLDMISDLIDLAALNTAIFAGDINGALRDNPLRDITLRGDDLYELQGFSVSTEVSFKLIVDGTTVHTEVLNQAETMFAMPPDAAGRRVEIEMSGYVPWKFVAIAEDIGQLQEITL